MVCSCRFLSCDELLAVPLCWHVVDAMHPFNNFLRLVCLRVQMTDSEMSTWRNGVSAGHVVVELGIDHVQMYCDWVDTMLTISEGGKKENK